MHKKHHKEEIHHEEHHEPHKKKGHSMTALKAKIAEKPHMSKKHHKSK